MTVHQRQPLPDMTPTTEAVTVASRAAGRREDDRLIRGQGCFVDDLRPEGVLFLVFVRAVQAGRLVQVDAEAARAMPGVAAVFTGADFAGTGQAAVNPLLAMEERPAFEPLATGTVVAGQAVAAVVAASRAEAEAAAEAVEVNLDDGDEDAAPSFSGQWRDGPAEAGSAAATTVSVTVRHAALAPSPMEPRATLAQATHDGLTVHVSCQTPYRVRDDIAAITGLDAGRIRVVAPDVGGAFGGKASITPEDAAVALAALKLRRPVTWRASRSEDFLSATRGRGATLSGTLGLGKAGEPVALTASGVFLAGHWWPYSVAAPARNFGRMLPGPYRIGTVEAEVTSRSLPGPAFNIYRGAGRPEAVMLMERLIDRAAAVTGTDPLAYRLAHLLRPEEMPDTASSAKRYDSADLPGLLKAAARAADYPRLRRQQQRRRRKGEVAGIGIATYIEPCGQGGEWARVALHADGHVVAFTGSTAQGQGRETATARIVAGVLGIAEADVEVRHGDTANGGWSTGALASRSTAIGGSAMLKAAKALKRKLVGDTPAAAAQRLKSYRDADGFVLSADLSHQTPGEAWASGAVIAAVAIDRETGVLTVERLVWADDAGIVLNPELVEGQLIGGMAQGYGEAMMERLVSDSDGQLLTGSLMDYALPRAMDVPPVTLIKRGKRSVMNPLGVKGVGEAGCIGIPAALVNAACDALSPFGVTHLDMPLTSETLWRAMNAAASET